MRFISLLMVSIRDTRLTKSNCTQCIYYEPRDHPFTNCLSKCRRFGERDSESGRITYEYADLCRKNEQKCGQEGKYFEPIPTSTK
jgi:hypothetical protein